MSRLSERVARLRVLLEERRRPLIITEKTPPSSPPAAAPSVAERRVERPGTGNSASRGRQRSAPASEYGVCAGCGESAVHRSGPEGVEIAVCLRCGASA
jgi:hypothetical protein